MHHGICYHFTYLYTYDNGNITSRQKYTYTRASLSTTLPNTSAGYIGQQIWSYEDSAWGDRLVNWMDYGADEVTTAALSIDEVLAASEQFPSIPSYLNSEEDNQGAESMRTPIVYHTLQTAPGSIITLDVERPEDVTAQYSGVMPLSDDYDPNEDYEEEWTSGSYLVSVDQCGNTLYLGDANTEIILGWNNDLLKQAIRCDYVESGMTQFTADYTYNGNGQRVKKTVEDSLWDENWEVVSAVTTITEYFYAGDILAGQKTGNDTLVFLYDNNGEYFGFTYNGTPYYYVKNLQGDVIAIADAAGSVVVEYAYDVWGDLLEVSGPQASTIGKVNPIRYRGYYYDNESGYYYCNSRYYAPEYCRFLSADTVEVLTATPDELSDKNLFAYCDNNPVVRVDNGGEFWDTVLDVISLCYSIKEVAENPDDPMAWVCLAADVVSIAIPIVSSGGTVIRALNTANDVANTIDNAADANKLLNTAGDTGKVFESMCFVAGTLVLTADGSKPIEEIQAGDTVWAWDETTGEVAKKQVIETYVNETDELVHIHVNGEEIISTPTHPFYSPVKGWTDAVDLRSGDILVLVNGEYVVVEQVQHELLDAPIKVYNFNVEDYHTYFVTKTGILVHNKCYGSYEILYESGKNYVGKGDEARMYVSARAHSSPTDQVVSMNWYPAPDERTAFVDEYFRMAVRGVNNPNTYNKIWSPGRKYFIQSLTM